MTAAVNNNFSTILTGPYGSYPASNLNATGTDLSYVYVKLATCAIPTTATDLAGSQYRMCRVFSSDIPITVEFGSTALTAGALSVGIWNTNAGAHYSSAAEHLFATSIDCSSAVAPADKRFTNLAVSTGGQRLWQLLGASSDPEQWYDLVFVSTTGATDAGTLYCRYVFSR